MPNFGEIEAPSIDRRSRLAELFREKAIPDKQDEINDYRNKVRENALEYLSKINIFDMPDLSVGNVDIVPDVDKINFHWGNKMNDVNVGFKTNGDKYIKWNGRF